LIDTRGEAQGGLLSRALDQVLLKHPGDGVELAESQLTLALARLERRAIISFVNVLYEKELK